MINNIEFNLAFMCTIVLGLLVGLPTHAQTIVPELAEDISPLLIGESIPEGTVTDMWGKAVSLRAIVSTKPTILIVYRGGWCPYCNRQLAELQSIEKDILDKGYQIIALSPDAPENLVESVDKHQLNYSLYSDADLQMIKAFGLAFQSPDKYKEMLVERSQNKNPGILPVPAVFIIGMDGVIQFEYINPHYNTRISGKMLKAVIEGLAK